MGMLGLRQQKLSKEKKASEDANQIKNQVNENDTIKYFTGNREFDDSYQAIRYAIDNKLSMVMKGYNLEDSIIYCKVNKIENQSNNQASEVIADSEVIACHGYNHHSTIRNEPAFIKGDKVIKYYPMPNFNPNLGNIFCFYHNDRKIADFGSVDDGQKFIAEYLSTRFVGSEIIVKTEFKQYEYNDQLIAYKKATNDTKVLTADSLHIWLTKQYDLGLIPKVSYNAMLPKCYHDKPKWSSAQQPFIEKYKEYCNQVRENNKKICSEHDIKIISEKREKLTDKLPLINPPSTLRELVNIASKDQNITIKKNLINNNGEVHTEKNGNIKVTRADTYLSKDHDPYDFKANATTDIGEKVNLAIKNGQIHLIQKVDVLERSEFVTSIKVTCNLMNQYEVQNLILTYNQQTQQFLLNGMPIGSVMTVYNETISTARYHGQPYKDNPVLESIVKQAKKACLAKYENKDSVDLGNFITNIIKTSDQSYLVKYQIRDRYYDCKITIDNVVKNTPVINISENAIRWVIDKKLLRYDEKIYSSKILDKVIKTVTKESERLTENKKITSVKSMINLKTLKSAQKRDNLHYLKKMIENGNLFDSQVTYIGDKFTLQQLWENAPLACGMVMGKYGKLVKKDNAFIGNFFAIAHVAHLLPRQLHFEPWFQYDGKTYNLHELIIKFLVNDSANIKELVRLQKSKDRSEPKIKTCLTDKEIIRMYEDNTWLSKYYLGLILGDDYHSKYLTIVSKKGVIK